MMQRKVFQKLEDTVKFLKDQVGPQVILGLVGDLGYGKTTLVNNLLVQFGYKVSSSPTFSLINKYQLDSLTVFHVDLYRLKSDEDVDASGFWDLFADENAFVIIEWVDRIHFEDLPLNFQKIKVCIRKNNDQRSYEVLCD